MVYEQVDSAQIGNKMRELRTQTGKSAADVANDVGISASAIAMYENGNRIPRDDIKIRIAEYYGVTVESIFYPVKYHNT